MVICNKRFNQNSWPASSDPPALTLKVFVAQTFQQYLGFPREIHVDDVGKIDMKILLKW